MLVTCLLLFALQTDAPPTKPAQVDSLNGLSKAGIAAADRGLAWLAQHQHEDGSWAADVGYKLEEGYRVWNKDTPHVGVTALAGMAFLAGGHVPGRGPYGKVVDKAVDFLLAQVHQDGYITANETRLYSHAFATLFLAEVYGMTQREDLRPALQKAVDLIVSSQNEQGGWRYQPHVADADMSVAACQVLALRSARNIGIQVPVATIDAAVQYVRASAVRKDDPEWSFQFGSQPGDFRYQPDYQSRATFALTAAGITILHGAGVYADEDIERGIGRLQRQLRGFTERYGPRLKGHYYFYYGHYYAVQAFHIVGGERYREYLRVIQEALLEMQRADGSWPNAIGPGTTYGTATACLILQIPKEYLPIFQR